MRAAIPIRGRRGLIYLEVVVASLVFALTLAGLGASIVAQEKLMRAIEQRAYVLVPTDRAATLGLGPEDAFWPRGRLEVVAPALAGLGTIEGAAYAHLGSAAEAGPAPRLLVAQDYRDDRWPEGGCIIEPPALDTGRMGDDGSPRTFGRANLLGVVAPLSEVEGVATLTVELQPILPEPSP